MYFQCAYFSQPLIEVQTCTHPTLLGNICCDCGVLLDDSNLDSNTNRNNGLVSMLHSIPDLKVSKEVRSTIMSSLLYKKS